MSVVLAHGTGGDNDLPIPLPVAASAAIAALVFTFAVIGDTGFTLRLAPGRPLPRWLDRVIDAGATRWALRVAGLGCAIWFVGALAFGGDDGPAPGAFYVLLWVGVPLLSMLIGPLWRVVNPLRALHLLIARRVAYRPYPRWLGYWPAAAGLASFSWLELVAPDRSGIPVIACYAAGYALLTMSGAAVYGAIWFARADAFEVYSTLAARLAPIGRSGGRLVMRNPLAGLDATPAVPGLVAIVLVLLGSTGYDALSGAPFWDHMLDSGPVSPVVIGTLGLAGCVCLVAGGYLVATALAGRISAQPPRPTAFAAAVVPIALGYVVAHYLSVLLLQTQRILLPATNPVALAPALLSNIQVTAVIAGHIAGTVAAHARAARLFTVRVAASQAPLLVLMIAYSLAGLALLLAA